MRAGALEEPAQPRDLLPHDFVGIFPTATPSSAASAVSLAGLSAPPSGQLSSGALSTEPVDSRVISPSAWALSRVRVGVTAYARDQLGQVVYVDLPAVGARVQAGEPFREVESTKTVSDLHPSVTGPSPGATTGWTANRAW